MGSRFSRISLSKWSGLSVAQLECMDGFSGPALPFIDALADASE
jgi:hypothetical protein